MSSLPADLPRCHDEQRQVRERCERRTQRDKTGYRLCLGKRKMNAYD